MCVSDQDVDVCERFFQTPSQVVLAALTPPNFSEGAIAFLQSIGDEDVEFLKLENEEDAFILSIVNIRNDANGGAF